MSNSLQPHEPQHARPPCPSPTPRVHPITSWQIDWETMETVRDFILGGSKITAMVIAAMKLKDAYSLEGKL